MQLLLQFITSKMENKEKSLLDCWDKHENCHTSMHTHKWSQSPASGRPGGKLEWRLNPGTKSISDVTHGRPLKASEPVKPSRWTGQTDGVILWPSTDSGGQRLREIQHCSADRLFSSRILKNTELPSILCKILEHGMGRTRNHCRQFPAASNFCFETRLKSEHKLSVNCSTDLLSGLELWLHP